jgi:hypothetical protein
MNAIKYTTTPGRRHHTIRIDGIVVGNVEIVRRGYRAPGFPVRPSLNEAVADLASKR